MKYLENKTYDSKWEMNMLESIEDLKQIKRSNYYNDSEDLLNKLDSRELADDIKMF